MSHPDFREGTLTVAMTGLNCRLWALVRPIGAMEARFFEQPDHRAPVRESGLEEIGAYEPSEEEPVPGMDPGKHRTGKYKKTCDGTQRSLNSHMPLSAHAEFFKHL